uniref:Uncharacterized protein n=1 Tax=Arundo donax TaxID=35708 RepID=A0A0A9CZ67_ARUDO
MAPSRFWLRCCLGCWGARRGDQEAGGIPLMTMVMRMTTTMIQTVSLKISGGGGGGGARRHLLGCFKLCVMT